MLDDLNRDNITSVMFSEVIAHYSNISMLQRIPGLIQRIIVPTEEYQQGYFYTLQVTHIPWDATRNMRYYATLEEAIAWKMLHNL